MVAIALGLAALVLAASPAEGARKKKKPKAKECASVYADDLTALTAKARGDEKGAASQFSYCVRSTAVYECLAYGSDGQVVPSSRRALAHGTGFAYRAEGDTTLLVTNQHLAEWPQVTSAERPVDEVPIGCKRVSQSLRIVESEADAFEGDDVPLTLVAADTRLDLAVLRAKAKLRVMPWKLGRSASLDTRNVVEVRGFPLGVFRATSIGKVISTHDRDTFGDWDHDDFVIDALLSSGNSGSPVLAVRCETGEYELVGIYHAGYSGGSALNVVIGIDEARDLLENLQAGRVPAPETVAQRGAERARLVEAVAGAPLHFPFGKLTASVAAGPDGLLRFELYPAEFPVRSDPVAILTDVPAPPEGKTGALGPAWFGVSAWLRGYSPAALQPEDRENAVHLLDALRDVALDAALSRAAAKEARLSREKTTAASRLEARLNKLGRSRRGLADAALDLAERLGPKGNDPRVSLEEALAALANGVAPPLVASGSRDDGAASGR